MEPDTTPRRHRPPVPHEPQTFGADFASRNDGSVERSVVGWDRLVWAFVIVGIVARLARYTQNLPLWSDECFLAVNFIDRGYFELLKPLDNGQICPPLFLWLERTAVLLMGFTEWSLRSPALLFGVASVILFERCARFWLTGGSLAAAVGIFAVSVHPIRHAAEAKPYSADLFASLVLLLPIAAWLTGRGRSRDLWIFALLLPPMLALSNPAVFVAGGLLLGLAVEVARRGQPIDRAAWSCCVLIVLGSFAVLHVWFGGIQGASAMEGLRSYWAPGFPPSSGPFALPGWLLSAFTGSLFAYPGGGSDGASTATFAACLVGAVLMVRRGQVVAVIALASPLALNLIAAMLQRYPFGPDARLAQYAAPGICMLAGAGCGALLEVVQARSPRMQLWLVRLGVGLLLACAIVPQVASWMRPYRMLHDQEAREFARRFWPQLGRGAEVACAYLDYGVGSRSGWQGRRAWYLCNQAVQTDRRPGREVPEPGEVSADHPLRCVLFEEDPDAPDAEAWLARMQNDYHLRSSRSVSTTATLGGDPRPIVQTWRIYEFTPLPTRGEAADASLGDVSG